MEVNYSELKGDALTLIDFDQDAYYVTEPESGYYYCECCGNYLRPEPWKIIRTIDYPEDETTWKDNYPYDMIYFFCKDCSNGITSYPIAKLSDNR